MDKLPLPAGDNSGNNKNSSASLWLLLGLLVCAAAAFAVWSLFFYHPETVALIVPTTNTTKTPRPTFTPTPAANPTTSSTDTPAPTDTPLPTDTPIPTDTPLPQPPTDTPVPTAVSNPDSPAPAPAATNTPKPVGPCSTLICQLLRRMADLSTLPHPEGTTSKQFASNNHQSPEKFWDYYRSDQFFSRDPRYGYLIGPNSYANYRIVFGPDGTKEYEVLPRTEGPGYIARVWFTHRQHDRPGEGEEPDPEWGFFAEVGNIRFYFDDEPTPRVDMPVTRFFGGQESPFLTPLVRHYRTGNGGNISHIPMPFYRSVRVTLAPNPPYDEGKYVGPRMFQIAVKRFDSDPGPFESFRLPFTQEEARELERVRKVWSNCGDYPYQTGGEVEVRQVLEIEPGGSAQIELPDPGMITSLRLVIQDGQENDLWMRIFWDGQASPGVEGPLRALFGTAEETRPYRSLPLGIVATQPAGDKKQHEFYNFFPMPFHSARILFTNSGGGRSHIQATILYRPTNDIAGTRFHALFKEERLWADNPANYRLLDVAGSGRYVGCILTGHDVDRGGQPYYGEGLPEVWRFPYLESDYDLWVDGQLALPGTGIEDDFDGGYYYIWYTPNNPASSQFPLSGCTWKDERVRGEVASQYRFYVTDAVDFKQSLGIEVEHGIIGNNLSVTYSSTAFWYQ
ncbi:MAG: DUF2961 domain-containing protein [Anaerolineae bacterium]